MMTEQEILLKRVLPYLRRLGYSIIRPEQWFGVGSRRVRADAVAYDNRDVPVVLVEMKRDLSSIGEEPSLYAPPVQQAFRSALVAEAPYFLLSDGTRFLWFRVDLGKGAPEPIETPPPADLGPSRLVPFHRAEEVQQLVTTIRNLLRSQISLSPSDVGTGVLKLLQAKVCDERRIETGHEAQFHAGVDEDSSQVVSRVQELYQHWSPDSKLSDQIPADIWSVAVSLLQPFSLLHTDSNFLRLAFEDVIVGSMRKEAGQYMTPHNLVSFMTQLLAPQPGERVLDPVCGTGGFLAATLAGWRLAGVNTDATANVHGIDLDPLIAELARLTIAVNGGQPENVFVANSLDQTILDELGLHRESFDVILANPPMGGTRVEDPALLQQYELAYPHKGGKIRKRQTREVLFLERCLQLLKPGGRVAIVVPAGLLSSPAYRFVREWLMQKARTDAVVSLPVHTFVPYTGAKTSVLALTKEPLGIRGQVFMAIAGEVGYDRRGRPSNKNDLPCILEEYRRYRETRCAFTKDITWTVSESDLLDERLDATSHRPEYRRILEQFGRLRVPVERLGEIAEAIIQGQAIASSALSETGVPVVGLQQIREGRLHLVGARHVPQHLAETRLQRFMLQAGDLLVSSFGKVGESALVASDDLPAIAGQGIIVVRLEPSTISTDFLRLLFVTEWIQRQIDAYVPGTVVPTLYANDLRGLLVPMPDRSTQDKIAAQLRQAAALREEARLLEREAQTVLVTFLEDAAGDAQ